MGSPATSPAVKLSTSRRLYYWLFIICMIGVVSVFLIYAFSVPYTPDFTGVPTYPLCNCRTDWPPADKKDLKLQLDGIPSTQSEPMQSVERLDPVNNFPRIIHQVWDSGVFPEEWREAQQSCRNLYPNYRYMLWSFADTEKLIREEHPWLLSTWNSYPYDMQRVDLVKYLALYHYGGVYLDSDVSCVENFDSYIQNLSSNVHTVVRPSYPAWYGLDTFWSKPRSPLMWSVLVNAPYANRWYGVTYTTVMFGAGTVYFGLSLNSYPCQSHIHVVPNEFFTEKYFFHHHASSWHHWDGHIIIFFYTHYVGILTFISIASVASLIGWCYVKKRKHQLNGYLPLKLPSSPLGKSGFHNA